ncbi:hypothetical protein [Paenibacillus gansuensis]|uniref:Uncharacterized protein n=1 Tax=Paenibacillus gansuensis TaxID=306542 RepID=A0ABW5P8Q1_9BACL
MEKILNNLYTHTLSCIEKKDMNEVKGNNEFFLEIFAEILGESKKPTESILLKALVSYIDSIAEKLVEAGYQEYAVELVRKFYKTEGQYSVTSLYFEKLLDSLFSVHSELKSFNSVKDISFIGLLLDLFLNTGEYQGRYYDNNIVYLFSRYYVVISKNRHLSDDEKVNIISYFISSCFHLSLVDGFDQDKEKIKLLENILANILKATVDRLDILIFREVIKQLPESNYLLSDKVDHKIIILKITIYLYYLIYKESIPAEEKSHLKEFGVLVKDYWQYTYLSLAPMWTRYVEIKSELSRWERMNNGQAKWLMMDSVVREFFLFFNCCKGIFDIDDIPEDILNESELFSFLNSNLKGSTFTEQLISDYMNFKEFISYNHGDNVTPILELNQLREQLLLRYKQIKFKELSNYINSTEIIDINKMIIYNKIEQMINEDPYLQLTGGNLNNINYQYETKNYTFRINVPIQFVAKKEGSDFKSIANNFKRAFESYLLNFLFHKGILVENITFKENNKIIRMLDIIKNLTNEGVTINSLVYGIKPDSVFLYQEDEVSKEKLAALIETLNSAETERHLWVGFDNNLLQIESGKLSVDIVNLSDEVIEDILTKSKREDGMYYLKITNEIHAPFYKEEARGYLLTERKTIVITKSINVSIQGSPGFILEIGNS